METITVEAKYDLRIAIAIAVGIIVVVTGIIVGVKKHKEKNRF